MSDARVDSIFIDRFRSNLRTNGMTGKVPKAQITGKDGRFRIKGIEKSGVSAGVSGTQRIGSLMFTLKESFDFGAAKKTWRPRLRKSANLEMTMFAAKSPLMQAQYLFA